MFHSFSARELVILILVLGSCFSIALCDDDDDDDDESEEQVIPEIAPAIVPETKPESVTEIVEKVAGERTDSNLTLKECNNPGRSIKEKCCHNKISLDNSFMKCALLHQKNKPKKTDKDSNGFIKFTSCLIECVFKSKKYATNGDYLNMKKVKSDAKKLYKDDKRQAKYMIQMYDYCQKRAAKEWHIIKKSTAAKKVFTGACKPYMIFVFKCLMDYGIKVSCPYFKWKDLDDTATICNKMKDECEELHTELIKK